MTTNLQDLAQRLREIGYSDYIRVGKKWGVGEVIYTGHDRYLEAFEARCVVKRFGK